MPKGAYTYEGGKKMSCSKSGLTGSGRMSSAHGLNSGNSTKGMRHPENRVGADCPGFKSGIPAEAHKRGGFDPHASQPSGHKSKA